MKPYLTILILSFFTSARGQQLFDTTQVEKILMTLPRPLDKASTNENVIKAIEAVDKKFRQISDSLFSYRSSKFTIIKSNLIETNDSVLFDPLSIGDKVHFENIVFYNNSLNAKVDSLSKVLNDNERDKLYKYLESHFDNFSVNNKKLNAQPVRIRYMKFPDNNFINIGIDIYGTHFLWIIEKNKNFDVIKVERLWEY